MKAARFYAARDVRVDDVAEPTDPGARQVLVEPHFCGICGTDLHEYVGGPISTTPEPHPLTGTTLPQILGHEFSSKVIAVGSEVRSVSPGDHVSTMPIIYCGECFYCKRGQQRLCVNMGAVGLNWDWGGMAELAILDEYHVSRLPDDITEEQGALIEPTAVAVYAVDRSRLIAGESVLVSGGGPIGALAALAAIAAGAGAVYVSEPNPRRAERLRALGVTRVFDPKAESVADELRELHEGVGVDVAIECSGNAAALNTDIDAVRKGGRVIQTGLFTSRAEVDPMEWSFKDLTIEGTWCNPVWYFPRVARLIASGQLPAERVITSSISIDEVSTKGFEMLVDPGGDEMKILVSS